MLNQIAERKREEISHLVLPEKVDVPNYSLYDSLANSRKSIGLIAEVKKASPSKGVIRERFDPIQIAKDYEKAGAQAISVLTDQSFFQGHLNYLSEIKEHVNVPVLRKDFILEEIQVKESKLAGADAILLIGELLEANRLKELYDIATEMDLECLVEVHSIEVLQKIISVFTPKIIGVNNRDLTTFITSLEQTKIISEHVPKESIFISESGIRNFSDVQYIQQYGAKGMLVGESLMRQSNVITAIKSLYGEEVVVDY